MERPFASGLPTPTDQPSTIDALRGDVQRVVESLIELGIMVHDYTNESQSKQALDAKIRMFVDEARQTATAANDLSDTHVPLDILQYIDDGRNPDIYSREFVELVAKQNQMLNGKTQAMNEFGNILADKLSEAFPAWAETIREAAPARENGPTEKTNGNAEDVSMMDTSATTKE